MKQFVAIFFGILGFLLRFVLPSWASYQDLSWLHASLDKILAKIVPRSWQDLAKILLRYPWRVNPGINLIRGFAFVSVLKEKATVMSWRFFKTKNTV